MQRNVFIPNESNRFKVESLQMSHSRAQSYPALLLPASLQLYSEYLVNKNSGNMTPFD